LQFRSIARTREDCRIQPRTEELLGIEDVIVRRVSSTVVGVHALTLTTGVMKEWVFYVAPGADIAKIHKDVRSQVASHSVHGR
jgi:hypothetical protein